jgi:hypothetical protein
MRPFGFQVCQRIIDAQGEADERLEIDDNPARARVIGKDYKDRLWNGLRHLASPPGRWAAIAVALVAGWARWINAETS